MTANEEYGGPAIAEAQDIRSVRRADSASFVVDAKAIGDFAAIRPSGYQKHFEKLGPAFRDTVPDAGRLRLPFAPSWCWPAFALTVPWLFYRKMYMGGIILVALPILLDNLLPGSLFLGSGLLIAVVCGLCGKSWYLDHVVNRLAKAQRRLGNDFERAVYIRRARGVSPAGGLFGLLIQIVSGTVIVLNLLPPIHY